MKSRAYIFVEVGHGTVSEVLRLLRGRPCVSAVDCVEGPPDVIMVVEAEERQELAAMAVDALTSVSHLTNSVQCLPVCSGYQAGGERSKRTEGVLL